MRAFEVQFEISTFMKKIKMPQNEECIPELAKASIDDLIENNLVTYTKFKNYTDAFY